MRIHLQQQISGLYMKRMTRQRSAIVKCFAKSKRALSVEEILTLAAQEIPEINLSTVYRNLKILIEQDKIKPVELPGNGIRYEKCENSHHHHFLCGKCDKLFNVEGCPEGLAKLIPEGFELHGHSITLTGFCKACKIPLSEIETILRCVQNRFYRLPFYQHAVSAGFPSPAEDEMEVLDLNELLIKRPTATFFLRVSGSSMIKAGIHDKDILVVDRSIEPTNGRVVIATINGELTVKRLHKIGHRIQLIAENDAYAPIDITDEVDFRIWGVVTSVIHAL